MKRDLSITMVVAAVVLVIAVFSFSRGKGNTLTLASETTIPTSGVLGATLSPTSDESNTETFLNPTTTTPTPSTTPPLTTPTVSTPSVTAPPLATCNSTKAKMIISATQFMKAHQKKEAYEALTLIYQEQSDDPELSFWLGSGDENAGGLYQTTTTNYLTKAFTLGVVTDTGEHNEIRGSKRCQMTIIEEREKTNADETVLTESYTRYLDFAVSIDGEIELTAFKDSVNGSKYSGFN